MSKIQLQVPGFQCERCKHKWQPRGSKQPRVCPNCKSPYWETPVRKRKT